MKKLEKQQYLSITGKWYINYLTGVRDETFEGTLGEAMKFADEGACYTQSSYIVQREDRETVASRCWHGFEPYDHHFDHQKHPVDFGRFGYYADWVLTEWALDEIRDQLEGEGE